MSAPILPSTTNWVEFLTPLAVAVAIVFQRVTARQVKTALGDATDASNIKLDQIHGLVNGNMAETKRAMAEQAERLASITKHPDDIENAVKAKRSYMALLNRQQKIDESLSNQLITEHRAVTSDGPIVKLIHERLDRVENMLALLPCSHDPALPTPSVPWCPEKSKPETVE